MRIVFATNPVKMYLFITFIVLNDVVRFLVASSALLIKKMYAFINLNGLCLINIIFVNLFLNRFAKCGYYGFRKTYSIST